MTKEAGTLPSRMGVGAVGEWGASIDGVDYDGFARVCVPGG